MRMRYRRSLATPLATAVTVVADANSDTAVSSVTRLVYHYNRTHTYGVPGRPRFEGFVLDTRFRLAYSCIATLNLGEEY